MTEANVQSPPTRIARSVAAKFGECFFVRSVRAQRLPRGPASAPIVVHVFDLRVDPVADRIYIESSDDDRALTAAVFRLRERGLQQS